MGGCGWTGRDDLKGIAGTTVRLRFILRDADLFSFRIVDESTGTLPVPRAATK